MKTYLIKWLDDDGNFVVADSTFYEAENELGALHQFAKNRDEDLTTTKVEIRNDDPDNFILYVEGYVENYQDMRFDIVGAELEYIAVEVENENRS